MDQGYTFARASYEPWTEGSFGAVAALGLSADEYRCRGGGTSRGGDLHGCRAAGDHVPDAARAAGCRDGKGDLAVAPAVDLEGSAVEGRAPTRGSVDEEDIARALVGAEVRPVDGLHRSGAGAGGLHGGDHGGHQGGWSLAGGDFIRAAIGLAGIGRCRGQRGGELLSRASGRSGDLP